MNGNGALRERAFWIAAVSVLATSLAWLAAIEAVLLFRAWVERAPEVLILGRALGRVVLHLGREFMTLLPLALLAPGLAVMLARAARVEPPAEGDVRHA